MEDWEYKEDEAVEFILKRLPAETKNAVKNEDKEYVIDLIYSFYDEQGYLEDEEDEVEVAEEEIFNYIMEQIREDGNEQLTETIVNAILDGEYEYCKSIGVYEEDEV